MLSSCLKILNKIILFLWKIRVGLLCFEIFDPGHFAGLDPAMTGSRTGSHRGPGLPVLLGPVLGSGCPCHRSCHRGYSVPELRQHHWGSPPLPLPVLGQVSPAALAPSPRWFLPGMGQSKLPSCRPKLPPLPSPGAAPLSCLPCPIATSRSTLGQVHGVSPRVTMVPAPCWLLAADPWGCGAALSPGRLRSGPGRCRAEAGRSSLVPAAAVLAGAPRPGSHPGSAESPNPRCVGAGMCRGGPPGWRGAGVTPSAQLLGQVNPRLPLPRAHGDEQEPRPCSPARCHPAPLVPRESPAVPVWAPF